MLICNELLLQKFITNQQAAKNQQFNNGVKQFKGILRNLKNALGASGVSGSSYLVNVNQYDMDVETLLYYNPMNMIHGNTHLQPLKIKDEVLSHLLQKNEPAKSFDRVKIWKINLLDTVGGQSHDILLSLHDIQTYYESELPDVFDLDNDVKLPNLLDLLEDYLAMIISHRSLLGRILLWKIPQYKYPLDPKTGRMLALNPDEIYKTKILDIYKQLLKKVQEQLAFEDHNALPLSLDA